TFTFKTSAFYDVETTYNGTFISNNPDAQDDDGDAWEVANQSSIMTPGKGYAAMATTQNIPPTVYEVEFTGKVNNGVIQIPIEMSANNATNNDDFNLIGNPYPSAIFSDNLINSNNSFSGV